MAEHEVPAADAETLATRADIERQKEELGIPNDPEVLPKEDTSPEPPAPVVPDEPEARKEDEPAEPEEIPPKPQLKPEEGKELKQFKADLQEKLQTDFDAKFAKLEEEFRKANPNAGKTETLEEDVKALAKTLNFDEDKTRAIIEVARKGLAPLSEEDKAALDEFKSDKARREVAEQEQIFTSEWNESMPTLKTQFPNATDEQLNAVKANLDVIAHSEKFHSLDMSDIIAVHLNKEFKYTDESGKEVIIPALSKTLFSPKQKTFESGRSTAPVAEDDAGLEEFNPSWNPAQVEAWEKRRDAYMDGSREPLHIITTDEQGRTVERHE